MTYKTYFAVIVWCYSKFGSFIKAVNFKLVPDNFPPFPANTYVKYVPKGLRNNDIKEVRCN